eukprot:TRINITY_DN3707_c0_g1_i2.p1 TRINITY_DN3707_c0_g1~~TRINITY_DN3707_c0_g1_i2.p1  ORF type:complete len:989 (+),score=249.21 TRINITY_DN3707_c0_g1_i2:113-3079(+)
MPPGPGANGLRRRSSTQVPPCGTNETAERRCSGFQRDRLNSYYSRGGGMTDAEIEDKMKSVVRWWSLTQLLGSFGMPLWLAVVATQWYTYRNMLPGHVALVITFSKCIDVMTDPLMAYYLRKCCMHTIARIAVLGSFVQSVFFAGIFIPFMPVDPWGGDTRVLLQYTVCYVLFFVGDTLTGTPTTTLGTMLKSQRILDERHHNEGLRLGSMAKVGGILLMGLLTYAVSAVFRSQGLEYGAQEGVSRDMSPNANFAVATFFGAAHWLINFYFSVLIMDFENSSIAVDVLEDQRGFLEGFSEMMTSSYNNPFFRQLIGAWVCDQLTITLVKNLLMWFVRHNVEPELGKGCVAFRDPANSQYIERGGFEVNIPKSRFECSADSIVKGGVFFVILGAVTGNVFWQRKLARERDEYGHGNLYRNWLLFNLSSALTNGLMVFVGRGDSRLFWALCFVNGLPFGGEFLTDTVLLFLIGSETWLNRTESPMGEEEHAAQFDAHTTKFSMMKTFIPKVVSLVAEAIPLSMIQIWYKDPNELCEDADGNFIGATACEEKLLYRIPGSADDGTPRYIPQAPQVRELIAFFFYILPTVTTLASYFLKSRFQVTDSADVGFTKSLKHGAPAGGGESTAERVKSPEVEAPLGLSQLAAESAALSAASLGEVQSALAFSRPKMQADAWVGQLIPTTNGQHLFHLPVCDHEFARLPVNVVRFVCQESARSLVLPAALCHQPGDSIVASRAKAAVHGLSGSVLLPACAAVRVLRTAAAAASGAPLPAGAPPHPRADCRPAVPRAEPVSRAEARQLCVAAGAPHPLQVLVGLSGRGARLSDAGAAEIVGLVAERLGQWAAGRGQGERGALGARLLRELDQALSTQPLLGVETGRALFRVACTAPLPSRCIELYDELRRNGQLPSADEVEAFLRILVAFEQPEKAGMVLRDADRRGVSVNPAVAQLVFETMMQQRGVSTNVTFRKGTSDPSECNKKGVRFARERVVV